MTKPVATETPAVTTPKAKKAPITPAAYLAAVPTDNQAQFHAWVLAETGITFKTQAEKKAFEQGVRAAGLYARYQASKREAK